jgi:hypothetical protein
MGVLQEALGSPLSIWGQRFFIFSPAVSAVVDGA